MADTWIITAHSLFEIKMFFLLLLTPMYRLHPEGNRASAEEKENSGSNGPFVFITVSSLASYPEEPDRLLEMNWYDVPEEMMKSDDSAVRLFDHDPVGNDSSYLVSVHPRDHSEGYYRTSIQFPRLSFEVHNLTDECLGYWIAFITHNEVRSSSCIRAYPYWMHHMRNVIGRRSLLELVIPGTHNAGSYAYYDPNEDTILNRYLVTQEEDIWNQFAYGIRCVDLRISYEKVNGVSDRFWITHGVFRTKISIGEVIQQVRSFLNATKEFVIMDFHRFVRGFSGRRAPSRHRSLIRLIERELGEYMIPASLTSRAKLDELWEMDKRLYVGYASSSRTRSRYLFPPVKHLWGDKDQVRDLFLYLNQSVCNEEQDRLISIMAQLTPTTAGAIFDSYGGLRRMAHDVNQYVNKWVRELWWHCANIVSTDFFLGNNIITEAIEINKKKFLRYKRFV